MNQGFVKTVISFRLSAAEKETLREIARAKNSNLSEYFRTIAKNQIFLNTKTVKA